MTRFSLALVLMIGLSAAASAQTATVTSKFTMDQAAPDLATANAYTYKLYADGSSTGAPIAMACTGAASPFVCSAPVPAFTPGSHTVTVTASNVAGESPKSAPLTFQMVIVPTAPASLRIG